MRWSRLISCPLSPGWGDKGTQCGTVDGKGLCAVHTISSLRLVPQLTLAQRRGPLSNAVLAKPTPGEAEATLQDVPVKWKIFHCCCRECASSRSLGCTAAPLRYRVEVPPGPLMAIHARLVDLECDPVAQSPAKTREPQPKFCIFPAEARQRVVAGLSVDRIRSRCIDVVTVMEAVGMVAPLLVRDQADNVACVRCAKAGMHKANSSKQQPNGPVRRYVVNVTCVRALAWPARS